MCWRKAVGATSSITPLLSSSSILLPGYVSDEELGWLYKNCRANFYPSHYEGFGLPVLEGMSLGAATVCSNKTSLPEVIGDAGFVLSPDKVKDWADVMTVVTENEGKVVEYGNKAKLRSRHFSWDNSAEQLLRVYERVMMENL